MDTMKADGTHDLFKIHDIRRYPLFYIEFLYVFFNLFGVTALILKDGTWAQTVPPDTSTAWEVAASYSGVMVLILLAVGVALLGLFALFRGGYKWRARHMFLQFILRLYVVIGTLSIYGFYPTTWMTNLFLALIAAIIYLKLNWESRRWELYINDA